MKNIKLLILACVLAIVYTNQDQGCLSNTGKYCETCYQRKPLYPAQGCGPVLPDTDPCAFYRYEEKTQDFVCIRCKTGYILKLSSKDRSCQKVPFIPFCKFEYQIDNRNPICLVCENEKYAVFDMFKNTYSCEPAKDVEHSDPNCLWGGGAYQHYAQCYRCQEGYTSYKFTGVCKLEKELNLVGCLKYDRGKCQECDVYGGYSMQGDGSCLKKAGEKSDLRMFGNLI